MGSGISKMGGRVIGERHQGLSYLRGRLVETNGNWYASSKNS